MKRDIRSCLQACAGTRGIFLADGDALAAPFPDLLAPAPVRVRMPSERNNAGEIVRTLVGKGNASVLRPEGSRRL